MSVMGSLAAGAVGCLTGGMVGREVVEVDDFCPALLNVNPLNCVLSEAMMQHRVARADQ